MKRSTWHAVVSTLIRVGQNALVKTVMAADARTNPKKYLAEMAEGGYRIVYRSKATPLKGKTIWGGLGMSGVGLYEYADTVLDEKWKKSGANFVKKVDALFKLGGLFSVYMWRTAPGRMSGKWIPIYTLAAKGPDYKVFSAAKIDMAEQLKKGIEIEKEHRNVYKLFKKEFEKRGAEMPLSEDEFYGMIAKAHLEEDKEYYIKLLKYVE